MPGSAARMRYEYLHSRMSTGGNQTPVVELGYARDRPKVSSNRSLMRLWILFNPSNGSHLTKSIIGPPFFKNFAYEKPKHRLPCCQAYGTVQRHKTTRTLALEDKLTINIT